MVHLVHNLLQQHSPINLFQFVINPNSFGQTVENIFYLSFNFRDARARLEIDDFGMPILFAVEETLTEEESLMENSHCIIAITMSDWEVFLSFGVSTDVVGIEMDT